MRGHDHDALADLDAVLIEIAPRGVGEHHARPVVVGEDERPFDGAGRQHDLARPHLPEPLAWALGIGDELGLAHALGERDEILRIIAKRLRARHQPHVRLGAKRGERLGEPVRRAFACDPRSGLGEKRAAGRRILVADDDARAARARSESRREPRGSRADDQHVAMIEIADVAIGVWFVGRCAEAGGEADRRLVDACPGPVLAEPIRTHEGLVVEPCADQRRSEVVDRADVEAERGPAVLARGDEPVDELDLGRAQVRGEAAGAARNADERVRLLRAGAHNSARPMIFIRPADQANAVGEQRGRERVALVAAVGHAVEGEGDRARAVERRAAGDTESLGHAPGPSAPIGPRLARLVHRQELVADRVAQNVEEAAAA